MKMKHTLATLAAAVALTGALAAPSAMADDDAKKKGAHIGGVEGGGVITGVINYEGRTPPAKPIRMNADPFCAKAHSNEPAKAERWVFGKEGKTLQNVLVYVSSTVSNAPKPKGKAKLDQVDCVYIPHVIGVTAGQEVEIHNSDATLHNVQSFFQNNANFNDGMPVKGMILKKKFSKPEMGGLLKCAVHPWMAAYVNIMPHPFFAVTGKAGTFEIHGLPDGEYEISTWHEFKRFVPDKKAVKVTVKDGKADVKVAITYSPS